MGFYDARIKHLYENCPRLVVISINAIFGRNHPPDAEVYYLNREQNGEAEEHDTFMDMLLLVDGCKYHMEFQLLEDGIAVRLYEYNVRETVRELKSKDLGGDAASRYEIEVVMPAQAVIFLAGGNKREEITVHMTLPDGQRADYTLPCISAGMSVEELIEKGLFILIPFQQVQLNERMNRISGRKKETKQKIAGELYAYRKSVKNGLEKLLNGGIITADEHYKLTGALSDLENYLTEKDEEVKEEVKAMGGDSDYVWWSVRQENKGIAKGKVEERIKIIRNMLKNGVNEGQIAQMCDLPLEEVQKVAEDMCAPV